MKSRELRRGLTRTEGTEVDGTMEIGIIIGGAIERMKPEIEQAASEVWTHVEDMVSL